MAAKTLHNLVEGSPDERALAAIELRHEMAAPKGRSVAAGKMPAAVESAELPDNIKRILERLHGIEGAEPQKSFGIRETGRSLETGAGTVENMVLTAHRRKRVAKAALNKRAGETDKDVALRELAIGMFDPSTNARVSCAYAYWRATGANDVAIPILVDALENAEDEDGQLLAAYALAEVDASKVSHLVGDVETPRVAGRASHAQESMTVIVHGTFAKNSEWYQPGGSFHSYIKENVYSDVYSGSDFYQWSGLYRRGDSKLKKIWETAAKELVTWVENHPANTIRLMGHSHGNNVINRATHIGLPKSCTLIQMSPGVRGWNLPNMSSSKVSSRKLFNFYARHDLVLLADGSKVTYAGTETEPFEAKTKVARFDHSYSHEPKAWENKRLKLAQKITVCKP